MVVIYERFQSVPEIKLHGKTIKLVDMTEPRVLTRIPIFRGVWTKNSFYICGTYQGTKVVRERIRSYFECKY